LASLLIIFALTLPDGNILRIVFGLPFLLFLPGYSLVSALWAKNSELDGLERIALSLGLSIVLVALAGLGLNYTPWGITLTSMVVGLYCLILVFVGITWYRRSLLPPEERFSLNFDYLSTNIDAMSSSDKIMVLVVTLVIVIGGVMLIYIALYPPQERFTELYILDMNGATENYPSNLTINESASIIINVVCHEGKTTDYTAVVTLSSETGSNMSLDLYVFSLSDEEHWSQVFDFSINETGKFKLEIALYKNDETEPYSTNHIWIDVMD
jgi:uncharacterized membrane protein